MTNTMTNKARSKARRQLRGTVFAAAVVLVLLAGMNAPQPLQHKGSDAVKRLSYRSHNPQPAFPAPVTREVGTIRTLLLGPVTATWMGNGLIYIQERGRIYRSERNEACNREQQSPHGSETVPREHGIAARAAAGLKIGSMLGGPVGGIVGAVVASVGGTEAAQALAEIVTRNWPCIWY